MQRSGAMGDTPGCIIGRSVWIDEVNGSVSHNIGAEDTPVFEIGRRAYRRNDAPLLRHHRDEPARRAISSTVVVPGHYQWMGFNLRIWIIVVHQTVAYRFSMNSAGVHQGPARTARLHVPGAMACHSTSTAR